MQLSTNLWLENGYYIDIDHLSQLRIVGPGDHLYFGMINENEKRNYEITKVFLKRDRLYICGNLFGPKAKFYHPIIGDIRTVRAYSFQRGEETKTFFEIRKNYPDILMPGRILEKRNRKSVSIHYKRSFGKNFYGSKLILDGSVKTQEKKLYFSLSSNKPVINFTLQVYSSRFFRREILDNLFLKKKINLNKFGSKKEDILNILNRTKIEISHLVKYKKTSGYDYGTIFPRDWTETAILGFDDFNKKALRYIIRESFKYVSTKGKGWHEAGVGEYAYRRSLKHIPLVTREMIDIEPRYLLTFGMFPEIFKKDKVLLRKIQKVASFIYGKAKKYPLIQFERVNFQFTKINNKNKRHSVSFKAGNWRDSSSAYLKLSSEIVPYDVNAVFYPAALRIIKKYSKILKIKDKDMNKVVSDWQNKKDLFKFQNKDGVSAYALALYDFKNKNNFKKIEVNHNDEAYDLVFGNPTEDDVKSLALRILDDEYFYTKSGPLIVGRKDGYNTHQYHGKVIWLKQFGLLSMGFKKQLNKNNFSKETKELIKKVIKYLFDSLVYIYDYQNLLPELLIDRRNTPFLYNNQKVVEGHMNKIQLWSAEAARRVILDYCEVFLKS